MWRRLTAHLPRIWVALIVSVCLVRNTSRSLTCAGYFLAISSQYSLRFSSATGSTSFGRSILRR